MKVGVGGGGFTINGTGNTLTSGNISFLSAFSINGTLTQSGGDFSEATALNNFIGSGGDYVISGGTVGAHGAYSLFLGNGGVTGTLDVVGTGATSITFGALVMSSTIATVQFDLGATGVTPISTGNVFGSGGLGTLEGILTINGAGYTAATGTTATLIPLINNGGVISAGFTTVNVNGINGVVTYTANGGKEVALQLDGTAYYFTGTTSNSFLTPGNFKDTLTGGTTHNFAPSSTSDVYLAANSPGNLPVTIGASNVSIHSLNFNANGAGSSLAGTGTLTLGSSATALSDAATGGTAETVSPNVVLGASQTWSVTNSTNKLSVSGLVSDGGSNYALTKTGPGSLVLSNTGNTFGGAVAVQAGTLTFGNGNASATAAQSLGENASLTLGVASTSSGVLQYNGTGAATLAKGISALGNGGDTIQNSGSGLLTLSGGLVKNGTTLTLNGGSNGIAVTGVISGSSANSDLDITGGTTTISTLATYNGPTWIYGSGVLVNGVSGGALPTGTSIDIGTPGAAGAATSTSTTAGTFDLGGNNQTVAGLNTEGTGPSYTTDIVTNNGSSNAILTVSGGGTFAGVIKNGSTNSTALSDSGGTLTLSGANTYSGSTKVTGGGTLVLANSSNATLASTSAVTLGENSGNTSGILQLGNSTNASSQTLASLTTSGTGSSNAVVGGNSSVSTLTINNSSSDSFSGILGGSGTNQNKLALVKSNSGTLTLSGADTYTGGTTINGGTLLSANATALGGTSGTLAVNGGGVLDLDHINQTVGVTTLGLTSSSAGSTIQSPAGTGTLTTTSVTVNGTNNLIASGVTMTGSITQSANSGLTVNGTAGADSMASGATLAGTGSVGTLALAGNNALSSSGTLSVGVGGAGFGINGTGNTFTGGNLLFYSALNVGGTITQSGGDLSEGGSFNNFLNGSGKYVISGGTIAANPAASSVNPFNLRIGDGGGGTFDVVGTGATSIKFANLQMVTSTAALQFDLGATGVTAITANNFFGPSGNLGVLTVNGASYTASATATQIPLVNNGSTISGTFSTVNINGINGVVTYAANGGKEIALSVDGTAYYFTGATSNSFLTAGNYKDMQTGGTTHNFAPSSTSDVYLAANSPANLPATIGSTNVTIDSLNFNANGAGSSLAGTGTVTLGSSGTALSDTATGSTTETVSPNVALGANQTWSVSTSTDTLAVTGNVSDGGHGYTLTKIGAGTLILSGANTFTGSTTVQGGGTLALANSSNATLPSTNTVTLGENTANTSGVLQLGDSANASNQTLASLTTSGSGSSNAVVGGNSSVSTLTINNSSADSFSGILGGSGTNQNKLALVKSNSGTLTLSGADTYAGGTTINGGTLLSANATGLGSTSGALAISGGGILDIDNIAQQVGAVTLGTGGSTIQSTGGTKTLTTSGVTVNGTNNLIAGSVSMTGAITQNASSALTVNGTGGTDALANLATLNGTGTVSTITLAGNNTVSSSGTLATSGITVSGTGNLIGTGTVSGAITQNSSSALTVSGSAGSDALATNATLSGSGSGSVTTVTLAGSDTLSGPLTTTGITVSGTGNSISSGTVSGNIGFSGTSALAVYGTASGTVAVTSGATLSGTGSTGAVTVSGGGNVNLQDSAIDHLTVSGLTTGGSPASTLYFDLKTLSGSTTLDYLNDTGNLTLNGSTTINLGNLTGTTSLVNGTYTLIAVSGTTTINGTLSGDLTLAGTALGLASNQTLSLIEVGNSIDLKIATSISSTSYTLTTSAVSTLLHVGQSTGLTTTLTNTGSGTADSIDYTGVGASTGLGSVTGGSTISGNVTNTNTPSTDSAANTSQTFNGTTAGVATVSSTYSSLANHTVGGSPSGTPTGTTVYVYSGLSTWAGTGASGNWGTGTSDSNFGVNWGNYQAAGYQGSPGVTAGYTGQDTATFTNVSGHSAVQVNLAGATPNLNSITFNASTTSFTLGGGSDTGTITLSGTTPAVNVTAGSHIIAAPVILGANTSLAVATGKQLTISGNISDNSSSYSLSLPTTANGGGGTTILNNALGNNYGGGTTVSGGKLYVNGGVSGTSSGTGSGTVTVNGGTLAGTGNITGSGVTINTGGTLASGDAQSGTSVDGTHLAITNTSATIASANLTFDLGAGNVTGAGYHTYGNPNTSTTYLTLGAGSTLNFTGSDSISLVDLTNGQLSLRQGVPYLLVDGISNSQYTGLVTSMDGTLNDLTLNGNGYVIGVGTPSSFTAITINQFGPDGITPLNPGPNGTYPVAILYLNNGDLEVVPEPGTWALMLGGLGLLVLIQRRRNKLN